jgi:molybdenum cofactor biosynthesis protein B
VSHTEHRRQAPQSVGCAVITVSDTRTEDTDTGGRAIVELLTDAGHQVVGRQVVKDDPIVVRQAVQIYLIREDVQAILTTGGTGISARDGTFETIEALLDKRLQGFGELFRMLSYHRRGRDAQPGHGGHMLWEDRPVAPGL